VRFVCDVMRITPWKALDSLAPIGRHTKPATPGLAGGLPRVVEGLSGAGLRSHVFLRLFGGNGVIILFFAGV
jgi:hypothetical protein